MSDKAYDIIKQIAMYWLPGLGTLYFALSGIWGLPYGEQIVGSLTALDAFLGVILTVSTSSYNTGVATVTTDEEIAVATDEETT